MLSREPWCWPIERIANLTLWQALDLIIGPAIEASRMHEKNSGSMSIGTTSREQWVAAAMAQPGNTTSAEEHGRMFDELQSALSREREDDAVE